MAPDYFQPVANLCEIGAITKSSSICIDKLGLLTIVGQLDRHLVNVEQGSLQQPPSTTSQYAVHVWLVQRMLEHIRHSAVIDNCLSMATLHITIRP